MKAADSLAPPHGEYSVYDENKVLVAQILHGVENRAGITVMKASEVAWSSDSRSP